MSNASRSPARRPLEIVTLRLFSDNTKELRDQAAIDGVPWQVQVRLLVDRALKEARRRRVVT